MPPTRILLTGATGYIGGTVLARFLADPNAHSRFAFTTIIRDPKKAETLKSFGVTPIVGSHSDPRLVERLASEADVVIAAADCDDLVAATATLAGLKKRFEASGKAPIFINTSGTGQLCDTAAGMHANAPIYDDSDTAQMLAIPPTAPHRHVDNAILAADASGFVRTYIILPSTVWGIAHTPFTEEGLQNPHSQQIPRQIMIGMLRKRAGVVGAGKNVWPNVEVHELSELYYTLYNKIVSGVNVGHGYNGFFFGANGEYSLLALNRAIGQALFAFGCAKKPEPTTFTQDELDKYFNGSTSAGSNSRCRATHSLRIGWTPSKSTLEMFASIPEEMETLSKAGLA